MSHFYPRVFDALSKYSLSLHDIDARVRRLEERAMAATAAATTGKKKKPAASAVAAASTDAEDEEGAIAVFVRENHEWIDEYIASFPVPDPDMDAARRYLWTQLPTEEKEKYRALN